MIDTHTHLYLEEFGEDKAEVVSRALASGVAHMIFPNVDCTTISPMRELHALFPDVTDMAMGLHPTEVGDDWHGRLSDIREELYNGGFVAVGEVGMDLYWDSTHREEQMEAFAEQLKIADNLHLPVIIHCREALDETLEVIDSVKPAVSLIFHSFTGSPEDVRKIRSICDPYFGINGVVTFKNASKLRESIPIIGTERILLETDSPYLAPVPHRGKRNESSYLRHVCDKVAEVSGLSSVEVETATDANACAIFNL